MSMYGSKGIYSKIVSRVEKMKQRIRRQHHRMCGLQLTGNSIFYGPVSVTWPQNVSIGSDCTLNAGVHLGGRGGIRIGQRCRLSAGAFIETDTSTKLVKEKTVRQFASINPPRLF